MEVPQRQARCQPSLLAQGDGVGEFEEAEVGFAFFGAHAHAHEFDFGDDEAVAGVAFAHQPMQMRQAQKVEGLLVVLFFAHTGVPIVISLDEADNTTTAKRVGLIVGIGRQVEWTVFFVALRNYGNVMLVALTGLEGCVDFGSVECGNDVLKCAFVGGLDYRLIAMRLWESRGWNRNVEKAGAFFAGREIGNSLDRVKVEVFPIFQISDVPPTVHMLAKAYGDLVDHCYRWVWSCQVLHYGGCRPIEAELGSEIAIPG